jgi:hypothetical protein
MVEQGRCLTNPTVDILKINVSSTWRGFTKLQKRPSIAGKSKDGIVVADTLYLLPHMKHGGNGFSRTRLRREFS